MFSCQSMPSVPAQPLSLTPPQQGAVWADLHIVVRPGCPEEHPAHRGAGPQSITDTTPCRTTPDPYKVRRAGFWTELMLRKARWCLSNTSVNAQEAVSENRRTLHLTSVWSTRPKSCSYCLAPGHIERWVVNAHFFLDSSRIGRHKLRPRRRYSDHSRVD